MRSIVTILLSALLLAGCVAQWPSHRTGSRWSGTPDSPAINWAPNMPAGNAASGDTFGTIHGL